MPTVYDIVKDAILNRKIVLASYHGYERVMCPHYLGLKDGRRRALFYQFAGESSSGLSPDGSPDNWRCLFLDELTNVRSRDAHGEWHTAPSDSHSQRCVDQVDLQVEP